MANNDTADEKDRTRIGGGSPSSDPRPLPFRWACHGDPDRCLKISGKPMWLCARCTGFYTGLLLGSAPGILLGILEVRSLYILLFFIASSGPLALDGITQYMGFRRSNNALRMATGLLAGFGGGLSLLYLFASIVL